MINEWNVLLKLNAQKYIVLLPPTHTHMLRCVLMKCNSSCILKQNFNKIYK